MSELRKLAEYVAEMKLKDIPVAVQDTTVRSGRSPTPIIVFPDQVRMSPVGGRTGKHRC